jgi:signal transduction histidine kinase
VPQVRSRRLAHYGGAVLISGVSITAREFLIPELGLELPYITLFPAVAFSGWLGGFGPGATCTALSALAAAYLWVPSTRLFASGPTLGDAVGLVLFCGVGLFVSALAEARLRALARTTRQVKEVRQAQEREQEARSEAEQANTAKDEFLAILAHELRQPLAAMVGALAVVRQQIGAGATPSAERGIGVMERQTAHLRRLVEDLLDASRVVRGQVVLQRHPLNALDVVRDAIDAARPRADERRQRLQCHLPDQPVMVNADATRLQQVLLNVLTNAVSYTPPDGDIRLRAEADRAALTIRVQDSGEGIAADDLPRIFSLFTRAGARHGSGLGIGLAVARSLVELHGGTIDASSEGPGRGSEFRITLPALATQPEHSPGVDTAGSEPYHLRR